MILGKNKLCLPPAVITSTLKSVVSKTSQCTWMVCSFIRKKKCFTNRPYQSQPNWCFSPPLIRKHKRFQRIHYMKNCTLPPLFLSLTNALSNLPLCHLLSLAFQGRCLRLAKPCFSGEIAPQQVWTGACPPLPTPPSFSHSPTPPCSPPPRAVHHPSPCHNKWTETPHTEKAWLNQAANLSHFFLRGWTDRGCEKGHIFKKRHGVGEDFWKANIADLCRLQTAVRWQRLPER